MKVLTNQIHIAWTDKCARTPFLARMYNFNMTDTFSQEEFLRYARQLVIPEVGLEGQRQLKATSVLVIGAGGLGSPVALYLAAAGIGHIGLVDDDSVDVSNLQRQILYGVSQAGQPKAGSARERLLKLNPNIQVDGIQERFTEQSAEKISDGYEILVDCSDNFPTRYMINDLCVSTHRPDVYGAVYRFEGQVSVFDASQGPCYRCVFPEPPPFDSSLDPAEVGVMGAVTGVIGSLQAMEVIKIALQVGTPLYGRMLIFDGLEGSFQSMKIPKHSECRMCGENPVITSLGKG